MNKSCFSDDSHFEVLGLKSQYVRRNVREPLNTFYILQAPKHPLKKMFWGCFTLNDTGRLCTSERMMKSTKFWKKTWFQQCKNYSQMAVVFFSRTIHQAILQKNANIFLKIEINFARLAWQLPVPKPHRKFVGYHKKVSLSM